jgi:beta-galactosidase
MNTRQTQTSQTLGVCYYPEHWNPQKWEEDAQMMAAAGITFVRIGEFAWSRMEPNPGEYDLGWLKTSIDTLHAHGLKVVLGTPTATPPKWLVDTMPDMLAVDAQGRPRKFGSRRHYCFSYEPYQLECDRIVSLLAETFGAHPGIAAWQTDNEYGCHDTIESYSPAALTAFRVWLKARYGSIAKLNTDWGNVFWSMEYRSFEEIDLPNLTVTESSPIHRLDFQRFSSDQVVAFNARQCAIIRAHSPGRTILHNFMGSFTAFDHYKVSELLDAASWDSYPLGFLDQSPTEDDFKARYFRVGHPDFQGFHHDLYRACGRGRWWVMEQQPGPVNWAPWNPAPAPGAIRLWAWEAFAAGAETVTYFRWRQAPFAQEQMHEALLLPNSEPNEAYHAVSQVAQELTSLSADVQTSRADVALVFDYESEWAWKIQPQGKDFSYFSLVMAFYTALRRHGISLDIIPPSEDAIRDRKLVLAPGLFTATEGFVSALKQSGAQVAIGPRTGSKTENFTIPDNLAPGVFRDLIDVKVRRVESIRPGIRIERKGSNEGHHFSKWREFIVAGAGVQKDILSEDGEAMLLSQSNAHYIAGWPDPDFALDIVTRLLAHSGLAAKLLHEDIRVRDNGNRRHVMNYGPEPVDISNIVGSAHLLIGENPLPPCGVAVFDRA